MHKVAEAGGVAVAAVAVAKLQSRRSLNGLYNFDRDSTASMPFVTASGY